RALLDVDVRFDATVFFLLRTVDSLDCVDEDCSEFSAADGGLFDPAAGGAGSGCWETEAICAAVLAVTGVVAVSGADAFDVLVSSTPGDAFWFPAAIAGDAFDFGWFGGTGAEANRDASGTPIGTPTFPLRWKNGILSGKKNSAAAAAARMKTTNAMNPRNT